MGLLDGRKALVTGGTRGIGRAICELFSAEGAHVAVAGRSEVLLGEVCDTITAAGGTALPVQMDVKDESSIKNAVSTVTSEFVHIDILVNNAGIIALERLNSTTTQTWDEVMGTNVRGVFLTCREVLPEMMQRRSGRIINVGSTAGRRGYVEQGAYCASKHALAGLTKVLAIETQDFGIRVNLLSPGGVLTDLSSSLRASRGEPEDSPEWMTAEEVAKGALYLCSQDGAAMSDELILRRYASEPWR